MRYRRLFVLLAAALLFINVPAYAMEDAQGSGAAPLSSENAGTEPEDPPTGDATEEFPSVESPESPPPLEDTIDAAPPPNSLDSTPPADSGIPGSHSPLAQLPTDSQPTDSVTIILTEDWVIEDKQGLTTLSPSIKGSPSKLSETLGHPGIIKPVTIQANGHQIVVKDGGTLILEEFDANSAQLQVVGEHVNGLFYVERGGTLTLNQVLVKTGGIAVYLEDGSDYSWTANNRDYPVPSKAGETAPLEVVDLYEAPKPLLVFDDTAWSDDLPAKKTPSLKVYCSVDGQREDKYRSLAIVWDTQAQADALSRREDCALKGSFLDEEGTPIPSRFTLELPVRFVMRAPVRLLNSRFTRIGAGDYYGELRFEPPQEAQSMRLELSEDGGRAWRELAGASVVHFQEYALASFYQPDDRPRHYRLVVEGGPNAGATEPVILPKPPAVGGSSGGDWDDGDEDDDFSGNRGGGTALDPPERELPPSAPESQAASQPPTPGEESSATMPAPPRREPPDSADGPPNTQAPSENRDGIASESGEPAPSQTGQQAVAVSTRTEPSLKPHILSPGGQAAAAAAGIAACGGAGALAVSQTLRGKLLAAVRRLLARLGRQ